MYARQFLILQGFRVFLGRPLLEELFRTEPQTVSGKRQTSGTKRVHKCSNRVSRHRAESDSRLVALRVVDGRNLSFCVYDGAVTRRGEATRRGSGSAVSFVGEVADQPCWRRRRSRAGSRQRIGCCLVLSRCYTEGERRREDIYPPQGWRRMGCSGDYVNRMARTPAPDENAQSKCLVELHSLDEVCLKWPGTSVCESRSQATSTLTCHAWAQGVRGV